MNSQLDGTALAVADARAQLATPRTSEVLRRILTDNPEAKTFSVEQLLRSVGLERYEASLMMFSLPGMVPVPAPAGIVALPSGAIAIQLVAGQKQIKLPRFVLNKSISRRSLAVAIHTVLPFLEAAEQVVRPRWAWVSHPIARRVIGLFVFLLAVAIAYPLFGFNTLHATSIFVTALGMAERDGLAVLLGVVGGLVSLLVLAASGLSLRSLRAKAGNFLRKVSRKLGFSAIADFLERRGYKRLASILRFEWSQLLTLWDPEWKPPPRTAALVRAKRRRLERRALPPPQRRRRFAAAA
ncbi:MAG: exopolysaccharide biosynthesis protein [Polyangiales bacterium]